MALNGVHMYLSMADNEMGLRILDIGNPNDIQEDTMINRTVSYNLYYADNVLYVATGGGNDFV